MFRTVPLSIIGSFSLYMQQWYMSYRFADSCPKHVEFYSKNKFETSVHLVGFIIRIYHDAQPHEHQKTSSSTQFFFKLFYLLLVLFTRCFLSIFPKCFHVMYVLYVSFVDLRMVTRYRLYVQENLYNMTKLQSPWV